MYQNQNYLAFTNLETARQLSNEGGTPQHKANIYLAFCKLFNFIGRFHSVEFSAVQILKLKGSVSQSSLLEAYYWLATAAEKLRDFENAEVYNKRIIDEARRDQVFKSYSLYALQNLAHIAFEKGDLATAQALSSKILKDIGREEVDPELYFLTSDNLLHLNFLLGVKMPYEDLFEYNFSKRKTYGVELGKNYNRFYLYRYYLAAGEIDRARIAAVEALEISSNFRSVPDEFLFIKHVTKQRIFFNIFLYNRYNELCRKNIQIERDSQNKFARTAFEAQLLAKELDNAERDKIIIAGSGTAVSVMLLMIFSAKIQRSKRRRIALKQKQLDTETALYKAMFDKQVALAKARVQQKRLIARELHDGVMNQLASTRLNLYQVHNAARQSPIEHRRRFADRIEEIELELQSIATRLDHSEPLCLKSLTTGWIERYSEYATAKVNVTFTGDSQYDLIDRDIVATLYRILQEALQNAYKYAEATHVDIAFHLHEDAISLTIADNGKGFNPETHVDGIGLRNMKNRVDEADGQIQITSDATGTAIRIRIPVKRDEAIF